MSHRSSPSLWNVLPQRSPAPCDRYKHACCSYRGEVFMLGGRSSSLLRDFWKYNVVRNEWTELDCGGDAAPEELQEHSMVAHQGFLYVFGGMIDSVYTKWRTPLWMFDVENKQWMCWQGRSNLPQNPVPANRKAHSAVVFGSSMYIYGGYIDIRGSSQEFWNFDFDTMLWSLLDCTQMEVGPGPRHSHSAIAHLDCMYLFGGLKGLREQRDLWRWSFASQAWTSLKTTSGPSKLVGHSAVVYRDSMLLFGGGETQQAPSSCLWRYSFNTQTWGKLAVLPSSSPPPHRIHHCCVGLGCSYQSALTTTTSTTMTPSVTARNRLESKLRPFKNKCFPSNPDTGGDIELKTFNRDPLLTEVTDCHNAVNGKGVEPVGNCLTFENQEAFGEKWSCWDTEKEGTCELEESNDSMAQHLPDLLLVLGGKPLTRHTTVSVWQMTLANL
ncbi:tRNA wybutosine-synthesizing protein 2/3/4 isoform X2 [Esox lucius]|nr:tRNA wybutosine-synthesizing protein 2/3/4 isoform X2 [Esox lucius]